MSSIMPPPPPPPAFNNKYKISKKSSIKKKLSFAEKIKRAYDFEADQNLSPYWKKEFAKVVEKPTYIGKFNLYAWFFGIFWLLAKGMWKNAIGLLLAIVALDRVLDATFGDSLPDKIGVYINYGLSSIISVLATRLYFIKKVSGEEPFAKIFKSKNFWKGDIQAYFGDETIKKPISNKGDVIISKYFSIDLKIQPQLAYLSILGSGLVILLLGIPGFFFNYPIEIRERDYLKIIPIFFGLPIALIGLFFLKISKNIKKWTFMLIGGIGVLFSVYVIIFGSPYIYTVAILFISSVLYLISTLGFIEQENNSKADLSSNSISLTSDKLSSHKTTEIIQFIKRNVKIISISFSIVVLIVITIFAFSIFNRTDRLIIGKDFSMTWEEFNVNKDCSLQSGGIWARAGECQEQFSNCRPGVCSKGDCKNGYGKMNFPSGGFFLGNFKDGEFTGSYNIQLSCEANSVYYGETLNSQINGKVYILRPTLDKKYPNLKCITVTAAIYKNDRFLYVETETEECFHKGVGEVKFQIAGSKGFFYK